MRQDTQIWTVRSQVGSHDSAPDYIAYPYLGIVVKNNKAIRVVEVF